MQSARAVIQATWGDERLGLATAGPSGSGAQDAHEAVRPTDLTVAQPDGLEPDAANLYILVRARTLASLSWRKSAS